MQEKADIIQNSHQNNIDVHIDRTIEEENYSFFSLFWLEIQSQMETHFLKLPTVQKLSTVLIT